MIVTFSTPGANITIETHTDITTLRGLYDFILEVAIPVLLGRGYTLHDIDKVLASAIQSHGSNPAYQEEDEICANQCRKSNIREEVDLGGGMFIIKRGGDGKYVAKEGSYHSYTNDIRQARKYETLDQAKHDACDNEYVVNVCDEVK